MPKLYVRENCAFCDVVIEAVKTMNLKVEVKDGGSPESKKEIISAGGKIQFPFLWDEKNGVGLYEADLIIEYLNTMYGDDK